MPLAAHQSEAVAGYLHLYGTVTELITNCTLSTFFIPILDINGNIIEGEVEVMHGH